MGQSQTQCDTTSDPTSHANQLAKAVVLGDTFCVPALAGEGEPLSVARLPAVLPMPEPQISRAAQEPFVSTPDESLERRLRAFESAIGTLQEKLEATALEHERRIALLEQKLALSSGVPVQRATPMDAEKPRPQMAEVLESARQLARAAAALNHAPRRKNKSRRARWLAFSALSLVVLFLCIGFTLVATASATQKDRLAAWQGSGIGHRHLAHGALAETIAAADFGDARAEARLALAYLRGKGTERDTSAALRWSAAAAEQDQPVGEYLLGALYAQGQDADPARAFGWFEAAAAKGNLKAMHNLAIAYAEGLGVKKDEAMAVQWFRAAAERGYVDSAFDLAVMYERGAGVAQDVRQALTWYAIAAAQGDQPSKARAEFLQGQMAVADARAATVAAALFTPLPALASANTL